MGRDHASKGGTTSAPASGASPGARWKLTDYIRPAPTIFEHTALADILESWRELLESALASRSGIRAVSPLSRKLAQSRSSPELLNAVQCLQKAVDYTVSNVSPAAVCGWLVWALR